MALSQFDVEYPSLYLQLSNNQRSTPDSMSMTEPAKTIAACMIVRDEAHVIVRCLDSLKPLVDFVLIEDTGSTDGTQDIVRAWLHENGVSGLVIEEPWQNFAFNRSHALAQLRKQYDIDYALMIDADDSLVVSEDFDILHFKKTMDKMVYSIQVKGQGLIYSRNQICSNRHDFHYRGVLHEFLEAKEAAVTHGHLSGVEVISRREGSRSRDPLKYAKDADVLEKALQVETDAFLRSRYTFYLARSYQDAGNLERALHYYRQRSLQGHWAEEVFESLLEAGHVSRALGWPIDTVLKFYDDATVASPSRAEALHAASKMLREADRFQEAYDYAKRAFGLPKPDSGLFLQEWVYDYAVADELSVSAYWTERYAECLEICLSLQSNPKVPESMLPRIKANADFAKQKIVAARLAERYDSHSLKDISSASPVPYKANESSEIVYAYRKQTKIYRTIHIVWVGDESKCPYNCIDTWRVKNPDWEILLWGNEELRSINWKNRAHIKSMIDREWCGVADMMRWEILHQHGGFAIDADSICVRPLEDWLFEPTLFASWENELSRPGLIANGYVYSHPRNDLIGQVIEEIRALPNMSDGLAWQLTGPLRLTETVKKLNYSDITIYPSHYFMPRHLTGVTYSGTGPIFAKQFWGRAAIKTYESLSEKTIEELDENPLIT